MSSEWEISELGKEAINASRAFSFKEHPKVVFVNTGDVLSGKFLHKTVSDGKGLPGQAKKALKRNDILLTEIRPGNGRYAYVDFDDSNYVVSTKFMVIESLDRVSPRFLYHVLTNQAALNEFQRIAESRSGTFPQITFDSIAHFPVPVPPRSEQEKLVEFLDALDDRITLLRETNTTLEAIAQALFKSWFVDFDPVHAKMQSRAPEGMDQATAALFPDSFEDSDLGPVPKGWCVGTIGDVASVIDCLHSKKPELIESPHPFLQLSNIRDDGLLDTSEVAGISESDYRKWTNRIEVVEGDCVITNVGRVGAVAQIPADYKAAMGRNMTAVRLKKEYPYPTYLIELLQSPWMRAEIAAKTDVGTILNALNVRSIPMLRCVLASRNVIVEFESITRPLRATMEANIIKIQTLSNIRDTLLPRLISGQLRIEEAAEALA